MFGLSRPHWEAALQELTSPSRPQPVLSAWKPKYDFGQIPTSLSSETWTPQEFSNRGFPFNPLPTEPVPTLVVENWDSLVQKLLNEGRITTGNLPALNEVRGWLTFGCPEYLTHPGTEPTDLPHHITEDQVHMVRIIILQ